MVNASKLLFFSFLFLLFLWNLYTFHQDKAEQIQIPSQATSCNLTRESDKDVKSIHKLGLNFQFAEAVEFLLDALGDLQLKLNLDKQPSRNECPNECALNRSLIPEESAFLIKERREDSLAKRVNNALDFFSNVLEKKRLRYFATWGTALGVLRHHGMIPDDHDVDLGIPESEIYLTIYFLTEALQEGLKPKRLTFSTKKKSSFGLSDCSNRRF